MEKENYKVFSPDLPGFGKQQLTKSIMEINDYVMFVLDFLKKNSIKKAIFLCHSFGGRVGAKLAANYPQYVEKLVLTGTPLIKQKLSVKKKILSKAARIVKKSMLTAFGEKRMRKVLYYILGEWDYYKLDPQLKETFKKVIAEDISPNLIHITAPTLVIWGEKDTFVKPAIGEKITQKIPHALYKEIPNASHKLPYEYPALFAEEVIQFLK